MLKRKYDNGEQPQSPKDKGGENTRDYNLPIGMVSLINVSILDTEDDGKYKKIRRLADEPIISEDTNP